MNLNWCYFMVGAASGGPVVQDEHLNLGLVYFLGAAYVLLFVLFATRKPSIALALAFGLAPIQRALPGLPAKMSFADFNLALAFGIYCIQQLAHGQRIRWGPLAVPVLLYLAICGLSSAADWNGEATATAYLQMIPYLVFSVILFSSYGTMEDLRAGLYLLIAVGLFFAISAIAAFSPNIYGMNKNGLGASLSCITIVAGELWFSATDARKKRIFLTCLVIIVVALLITLSRGSWLAAAAGLLLILALRGEFKTLTRSTLVLVPLIALFWAILPAEDKQFATNFDPSSDNISRRLAFIDNAWARFQREPLLGSGVGLRKNMDATNVVLMSLAESGVLGLAAFLFMHFVVAKMAWRARGNLRRSSWAFSCLAIGAALMMAKLVHGFVDHYWSRGSLSLAWAGAGMVTRAWYQSCQIAGPAVVVQIPGRIRSVRRRRPTGHSPQWPGPAADLPPHA